MKYITLDFETYYDKDFSLSKITTEEYIRGKQFEVIGVSTKVDDGPIVWVSGTYKELKAHLDSLPWGDHLLLAQNTAFDAAILNWRFGIKPAGYLDTMSMAMAMHGLEQSVSLANLAKLYNEVDKGEQVKQYIGYHRKDFSPLELEDYGTYCSHDVELCYNIFNKMLPNFPKGELRVVDLTIRMFTEPSLWLDGNMLHDHLAIVRQRKESLLASIEKEKEHLMSNDKFAELLIAQGIEPPTKISPATGKDTWAFAKTDEGFKELLEHENEAVQILATARLGVKSTIEETRTERFIEIAQRGLFPIPLRYYAAHTGRWGGDDKVNLQNLPRGSTLKDAIMAPPGHVIVDSDSSQIEARTLAWLAEQNDLVDAFERGEDVYRIMAGKIYGKPADEINKDERFFGKTTILGCGYGMGHVKFQLMLKLQGVEIDEHEAQRIITIYRSANPRIKDLWGKGGDALAAMLSGGHCGFGKSGVVEVSKKGFLLPSGLKLFYNNLSMRQEVAPNGQERKVYTYDSRNEKGIYIYGGKVVENVVQALARCIIAEQMVRIAKNYRVVLTVHDAIMCLAKDEEVEQAKA